MGGLWGRLLPSSAPFAASNWADHTRVDMDWYHLNLPEGANVGKAVNDAVA